jgi:hypothetical protein
MWYIPDWWFRRRFQHLNFKIDNFTKTYQSECREEIKKAIAKKTEKKEHIWTRIQLKDPKLTMLEYWTDILGHRHKSKQPLFTESEIAGLKNYRFLYWGFMVLLVLFETVFFSFFAGLLLPKELRIGILFLAIGFTLAVFFAFALHFSLRAIFDWYHARHLIKKYKDDGKPEGVRDSDITQFVMPFYLGIVGCLFFLVMNVSVGFVRAYLIDPTSTMTDTTLIKKIDVPWHIFSVLFPISLAFIMALAEHRLGQIRDRLKVYENFKRQQKEYKKYKADLLKMGSDVDDIISKMPEEYWSVTKDLQRIFGQEVDEGQTDLLAQLNGTSLGKIDQSIYEKYSTVAATRLELFRYPIDNDPAVVAEANDLKEKINGLKAYEDRFQIADAISAGTLTVDGEP